MLFGVICDHVRDPRLDLRIEERIVQIVRALRAGIVNDDLRQPSRGRGQVMSVIAHARNRGSFGRDLP